MANDTSPAPKKNIQDGTSTSRKRKSIDIKPSGQSSEKTFEEKKADADIKNKNNALSFVLWFVFLITIYGIAGLSYDEETYGKYWGKIIDFSCNVVLILVGFVVGSESGKSKN